MGWLAVILAFCCVIMFAFFIRRSEQLREIGEEIETIQGWISENGQDIPAELLKMLSDLDWQAQRSVPDLRRRKEMNE